MSAPIRLLPGQTPGYAPSPYAPARMWQAATTNWIPYAIAGLKMHAKFSIKHPAIAFTVEQ